MAFRFHMRETRKEQLSRISLDSVGYIAYIPGVARCTWTIIISHCIAPRPEYAHRGPDTQQGQPTWMAVGFPGRGDGGGTLWVHGASDNASRCSATQATGPGCHGCSCHVCPGRHTPVLDARDHARGHHGERTSPAPRTALIATRPSGNRFARDTIGTALEPARYLSR